MSQESSLKKYDRPADRIRLHRQNRSGPILAVEGLADQRFCARVLGIASSDVFIVGTRNVVLDSLRELAGSVRSVIGIVDRDFDDLVSTAEQEGLPVAAYDNLDLEAMLVTAPAFDCMVEELASSAKLSSYGGVEEVRRAIVECALIMARIRRASAMGLWGIRFDETPLGGRMRRGDVNIQTASLCDALLAKSPDSNVERAEVIACVQDSPHMCPTTGASGFRGKDALSALGALLAHKIGSTRFDDDHLGKVIRLTADREHLDSTVWLGTVSSLISL